MGIAAGVFKQLAYKVESTYGVAAGTSGGQLLRRTQSTLDLSKDTYQSNEMRSDFQVADFRHGVRRVGGKIDGELSPKTYGEFFAALMKRDFAAVTAITGLSITIAGSGPTYTVTRASGDYISGGLKVGDVIRLSAGSFNVANSNKNLLIVTLTATVATVVTLNGSAMVAEGPIASSTATVVGKKTFVPTSAHTDKAFSIEHWFPDVPASELFLGCKFSKASISLPPTGMATVSFDVVGQDFAETTAKRTAVALTSQYFSSPSAVTSTGVLTAVNGVVRIGGAAIATLTGLSVDITANYTGDPVVGANVVPNQFAGRVLVGGQATMYFESTTIRDAFVNETEVDLLAAFTTDNTATADFLTIVLPRVKFGGASKDDGEKGLVATLPFTALLNSAGGTGVSTEKTTILMQDSQM
jgi:hypothetical protein